MAALLQVHLGLVWGLQRSCAGRKWRWRYQPPSASATYARHTAVGALKLTWAPHQYYFLFFRIWTLILLEKLYIEHVVNPSNSGTGKPPHPYALNLLKKVWISKFNINSAHIQCIPFLLFRLICMCRISITNVQGQIVAQFDELYTSILTTCTQLNHAGQPQWCHWHI